MSIIQEELNGQEFSDSGGIDSVKQSAVSEQALRNTRRVIDVDGDILMIASEVALQE